MRVAAQVQSGAKRQRTLTQKESPAEAGPAERRLYKIDHFNEKPASEAGRLLTQLRERI